MFAESSIYNKKHKMTQSEIDIARSWRVTVEQLYISYILYQTHVSDETHEQVQAPNARVYCKQMMFYKSTFEKIN